MKGACAALFAILVENVKIPGQVRERTGPALIHNQLVDRSLQTNVCDETVCYEVQLSCLSRCRSLSRDCLSFQLGILPGKVCNRAPLLHAVIGHAQLKRLDPGLALAR